MVQRVFLSKSPPRLIASKAGKNATPALADADKSFDSNWFDGGGLKWIIPRNKTGIYTPFPYPLNYIPYIWGFVYGVWNGNQSQFADQYINTKVIDAPPRGTSRYIGNSALWRGNAETDFYATRNGIYNQGPPGGSDGMIDYFVVFEG